MVFNRGINFGLHPFSLENPRTLGYLLDQLDDISLISNVNRNAARAYLHRNIRQSGILSTPWRLRRDGPRLERRLRSGIREYGIQSAFRRPQRPFQRSRGQGSTLSREQRAEIQNQVRMHLNRPGTLDSTSSRHGRDSLLRPVSGRLPANHPNDHHNSINRTNRQRTDPRSSHQPGPRNPASRRNGGHRQQPGPTAGTAQRGHELRPTGQGLHAPVAHADHSRRRPARGGNAEGTATIPGPASEPVPGPSSAASSQCGTTDSTDQESCHEGILYNGIGDEQDGAAANLAILAAGLSVENVSLNPPDSILDDDDEEMTDDQVNRLLQ